MRFYLGTHEAHWLRQVDVPLFVSHRRLRRYKRGLPRARCRWALDSGAFTQLNEPPHRFTMTVSEYVEAVGRYRDEVGLLDWAAPMDWMCEPFIIAKTGLSVREHQERTVSNYLELRGQGPFVPVLQGWALSDYEACMGLYADAGVDLQAEPVVGVGSVCKRQDTEEIGRIMLTILDAGISAHGFGVKKEGVLRYGCLLTSADSMAWSYNARKNPPMPGCTHKTCSNCQLWALRWREQLLAQPMEWRPMQLEMAA